MKQKMNEKERLLRKARRTKTTEDWDRFKTSRNQCNNHLRKAKQQYHQNLLTENRNSPRAFWKTIKSIFPSQKDSSSSSPVTLLKGADGTSLSSNAETFCHFFSSVAKRLKQASQPLQDFIWKMPIGSKKITNCIFKFDYVSKIFVEKELKSFKRHKATGVDNIPTNLLKDSAAVIAKPLAYIINLSLSTGTVPTEWKTARITPIHKSGDVTKADNYRPISILPAVSKILEKAVQKQLLNHLEENNLLSDSQFGYRKKRSTELATALFLDSIRKAADTGCLTGAVFIDLSKAFDTIGHSTLIRKLRDYGVKQIELDWFTDYLFGRFQYVNYENKQSEKYPINCGVPQGSILGPILFLIFFDDIDEILHNSNIVKFADDTVIYASNKDKETIEHQLNEDLKRIQEFFAENELIANLKKSKTESILFGTAKKLSTAGKVNLQLGNTTINNTETYKYLGTTLDSHLNLDVHFSKAYKKTSTQLRLLSKIRKHLTDDATKTVIKSYIQPSIMFNCLANLNLNNTQIKKLKSMSRRITSLSSTTIIDFNKEIKKHAATVVRKCIDKSVCENFQNYFKLRSHTMNTRNNNISIELPKCKLEFSKRSFYYMGAKIYNGLPKEIRESEGDNFYKVLKSF